MPHLKACCTAVPLLAADCWATSPAPAAPARMLSCCCTSQGNEAYVGPASVVSPTWLPAATAAAAAAAAFNMFGHAGAEAKQPRGQHGEPNNFKAFASGSQTPDWTSRKLAAAPAALLIHQDHRQLPQAAKQGIVGKLLVLGGVSPRVEGTPTSSSQKDSSIM